MKKFDLSSLGKWIILATVLGAVTGLAMGKDASMFAPVGNLFMTLIKMIVVPMVFFSLVGGAASLGNSKSAGKIGLVTFLYYGVTTAVAVVLGILFSEAFQPGANIALDAIAEARVDVDMSQSGSIPGFWETITGFVPVNPFAAMVEGNILQIIVFALFIGFALSTLEVEKKDFMMKIFNYCTEIFIKIMTAIMYVAPLGVFALMADACGTFGYAILVKILYLIVLYVAVLILVTYVMIGGSVALFSKKVGYVQFFKSMWNKGVVSFALPLGATINMNGNAAYYAMAACFFAQMYGIDLSVGQYVAIIITSTLGAVGQAGVPGPTLLVVAVLVSAGIPIEALPILFGVDRIFDMLRTAVNITGDAACACIVDRLSDES